MDEEEEEEEEEGAEEEEETVEDSLAALLVSLMDNLVTCETTLGTLLLAAPRRSAMMTPQLLNNVYSISIHSFFHWWSALIYDSYYVVQRQLLLESINVSGRSGWIISDDAVSFSALESLMANYDWYFCSFQWSMNSVVGGRVRWIHSVPN